MKQERNALFDVVVPNAVRPLPDKYELLVARILAEKFASNVVFVERGTMRTPDIRVVKTGEYWEIKNIRGNGRSTIEDNLRKASKQADRVVISLFRSGMSVERAASGIRWYLRHAPGGLKQVILISKRGKVIDFYV